MAIPLRNLPVLYSSGSPRGRVRIERGKMGLTAPTARRKFLKGEKFYNRQGTIVTRFDLPEDQRVILKLRTGKLELFVDGR